MHLVRRIFCLLAVMLAVVDARTLDGGTPQAQTTVSRTPEIKSIGRPAQARGLVRVEDGFVVTGSDTTGTARAPIAQFPVCRYDMLPLSPGTFTS